jgi:hypothetical protein
MEEFERDHDRVPVLVGLIGDVDALHPTVGGEFEARVVVEVDVHFKVVRVGVGGMFDGEDGSIALFEKGGDLRG